ncbi:hypothetical protein NEOLEDRAFT_294554 [Neolentinus lepideus HHB14362 ss-1]|uniref:RING-type domain-containing protein n=1 Tax=Neolentinus lepideus HHB14362 ss-1 TaxID=1314782 RepID=A0A165T110_9AGAM|nr:hypothetical protein NEOLEDRAFT_294554 [Neolentinus lepideus HHB14362 ss-1]
MLVVHPNSTCDVCLEGYTNGNNIPHSISCGHVFCLRCLQSLTRLICPLCRTTFDPTGIRRLHVDKSVQSISATTVAAVTPAVADPEVVGDVRRLEDKIDHIVLEGASLTDVRNTIDEVHAWLKSQPKEEQHRDLRASHRLLYRVTEDRTIITNMEKKEEEMKMRLVEAERLMEDIAQKRKDEATVAFAVEKSLREHYNRMNAEWNA